MSWIDGKLEESFRSALELLMLISLLNEKFGVEVTVDDIIPENFNSVDAIAEMVKRLAG